MIKLKPPPRIENVHQLVNQFLDCVVDISPPYLVVFGLWRSRRLKQIDIRTKAEAVGENLIYFYYVVLHVDSELCAWRRMEGKTADATSDKKLIKKFSH
jgi:hypothetical protein